ncbi:MAG: ATP-binding protein, partial [Polyangiales bacterium]
QVMSMRELETAEARYRLLLDRIPEVVWTARQAGKVTFVTDNVSRLFGLDPEEIYADGERFLFDGTHPEDRPALQAAFEAMRSKSEPFDVVFRWRRGDEPWMWLRNRAVASYEVDGTRYVEGMLSDVTAERKMEEALRQAQKMEAIGQLTGGIAHDFNNILAAIVSNTYFLTEALEEGDPRRADADEIQVAVERASALTRQLLAFSRRQVLAPTCFDINDTVRGLERMLRRLIGEDVEFVIRCAEGIGKVRADVGQVEQVVMNLVVNARDAMPTGGKLTIETADVELDAGYAADHPTVAPGAYVVVSVSDTGCGMSREVQARLFEPFFTTKEQGKGTGLGLSTAYGIVKQSGGHISVYSEVGHGTVFRVYLPRVDARPETARRSDIGQPGGTETILVVEDDERLRAAVTRILSGKGYRLLVAGDGASALKLLGEHEGPVHLVLSDAIMPGMSGPEAVREVQRCSPETRALFMSGYTDHAVLREGALQSRVNFIQKPFAPHALLRKVREVLDA